MKPNPHTEYEKLAQEVYQALLDAEGLNTVNVAHNKEIEGRSGCKHQIDVYWEVEMAGELFRVAIECKNYGEKVEIRNIRDFFGVVYDIGGIKGILVTKVGYDSGAITFADYYNLSLKEIRIPTKADWKGHVKDIAENVTLFGINVTDRYIQPDVQWLFRTGNVNASDSEFSFKVGGISEDELIVYDSAGNKVTDFLEMKKELLAKHWEEKQGLKHTFSFEDGFVDTLDKGRIKVSHIEFTYDILAATETTLVEGQKIARAIIKDVKTGKIKLVDKDGNVR